MANTPQSDEMTDEEIEAWNREMDALTVGLPIPPIPDDDGSEMQAFIGPMPKPKKPKSK